MRVFHQNHVVRVHNSWCTVRVASSFIKQLGVVVLLCLYCVSLVAAKQPAKSDVEGRLQEVYVLISQARNRDALQKAEALVKDYPHFQLGQLVYADLLQAQYKPVAVLGSAPEAITRAAPGVLSELREESRLRVQAIKDKVPAGMVPALINNIGTMHRHFVLVDSNKGRLYLFERTSGGLRLVKDYYSSVGRAGVSKRVEGDLRTPLGVYFIRSKLDGKKLDDLYGWGALPIDYPNPLDKRLGRTGSGIWIHGTPSKQYSRAPQATEGCVAIANPDMREVMRTVATRTTPVIIASSIDWRPEKEAMASPNNAFLQVWSQWRMVFTQGKTQQVRQFYDLEPSNHRAKKLRSTMLKRLKARIGVHSTSKDVSILRSTDKQGRELAVVSYRLASASGKPLTAMRQYWLRDSGATQWKIFDERSM